MTFDTTAEIAVNKAARLALLGKLQQAGVLDTLTLVDLATVLDVTEDIVINDLQMMADVDKRLAELMTTLPWVWLSSEEFAEAIGARPRTVRAMLSDGLIPARKAGGKGRHGRWRIHIDQVGKFKHGG